MPRVRTKSVSLKLLAERPEASTIVKLMMACNDMFLANRFQGTYKAELPPTEKHMAQGGSMYFIRLQMAHLHEGMKLLEEIKAVPRFRSILARCSPAAQRAYRRLLPFQKKGPKSEWFDRNVAIARHNLTFHYQKCRCPRSGYGNRWKMPN